MHLNIHTHAILFKGDFVQEDLRKKCTCQCINNIHMYTAQKLNQVTIRRPFWKEKLYVYEGIYYAETKTILKCVGKMIMK